MVAVARWKGWKYDPSAPIGFSPIRWNREAMNCEARSFSGVAVNRPRKPSPARKNRSAFRSCWRIESFRGADGSAPGKTAVIQCRQRDETIRHEISSFGRTGLARCPSEPHAGFTGSSRDEARSNPVHRRFWFCKRVLKLTFGASAMD